MIENHGSCWTLPAFLGICYQQDFPFSPMASVTKKPRSKYWFACFRELIKNGEAWSSLDSTPVSDWLIWQLCAGTISTWLETKSGSRPGRPVSVSRFQLRRHSKLTLKPWHSVVRDIFIRKRRPQSQAKNAPELYRTNLPICWRRPGSAIKRRIEAKAKAGMRNARRTV